ncbi:5808_t:CDS:1, partial [Racocetra persica]
MHFIVEWYNEINTGNEEYFFRTSVSYEDKASGKNEFLAGDNWDKIILEETDDPGKIKKVGEFVKRAIMAFFSSRGRGTEKFMKARDRIRVFKEKVEEATAAPETVRELIREIEKHFLDFSRSDNINGGIYEIVKV